MNDAELYRRLPGPVLVLGASGFIGANLFRALHDAREDVWGTYREEGPWRLADLPSDRLLGADLSVTEDIHAVLDRVKPKTVFNCVAYGAYSFEQQHERIYETNFTATRHLVDALQQRGITAYIHSGSSSEYGTRAAGPSEDTPLEPNSHYSVSKGGVALLLHYYGKHLEFPCANLRLYSVYGPYEDAARLLPAVIRQGVDGGYPPFVSPEISRDFVYVDDVCRAYALAALNLQRETWGESFNIGSGRRTTIREVAGMARELFELSSDPDYSMPSREWDEEEWYADPAKAESVLGWKAETPFRDGLARMVAWYRSLEDPERYWRVSRVHGLDREFSVSAIVACYKDNQAIPIMHERLTKVFRELGVEYEILFVNDNSPDDSEEVIRRISSRDRRVIGISHSRNFGSQHAFRSGMQLASMNSCVLLDGDLQDPPEVIAEFHQRWKEGFDVVYGRRVKREAPWFMQLAYKMFYRLFRAFSYIDIPLDAGDFSLIDRKVVNCLLEFPERDLFLRGVRAFAGFRQTGVPYERPERMFGRTTNSLWKNLGWAKKGLLSFSNAPINMLSAMAVVLVGLTVLASLIQIVLKLAFPEVAPAGVTTTLLLIAFFGALNLAAVALVAEYLAKVLEEVKRRPHYLRRAVVRNGTVKNVMEQDHAT